MTGKGIGQATIRDVAREADVSVASVSRVFNRLPNVRPELKERVEQAARKLNYVPVSYTHLTLPTKRIV